MTTSIADVQQQQLRKVAILVTSLDEVLSERLLAELPARDEAAVRQIAATLTDVDQVERESVVKDFRQGVNSSRPQVEPRPRFSSSRDQLDGVELDASLLARLDDESPADMKSYATPQSRLWQTLSDSDAATLVEMLSAEQPQTIAVVLARLEPARAAELVARLSPMLQTEVLSRLSELDPADEQSLEVVESQLAKWISTQRQKRQRMAAGRELVQQILRDTPTDQRAVLLTQLRQQNPSLAQQVSGQTTASRWENQLPPMPQNAPTVGPPQMETPAAVEFESEDPLSELESLDDSSLLRALRLADRQTVLLALTGASEKLLKRIAQGLPRRRAGEFRQQIRAVGPVRLGDMLSAQRELVRFGKAS